MSSRNITISSTGILLYLSRLGKYLSDNKHYRDFDKLLDNFTKPSPEFLLTNDPFEDQGSKDSDNSKYITLLYPAQHLIILPPRVWDPQPT